MTESFLIDTHAWYWFQDGTKGKLRPTGIALIEDALRKRSIYLSVISIWELAMQDSRGKIAFKHFPGWVELATGPAAFQVVPISPEVAIAATRLPGELHRDPADRFLAATARVENMTLLTQDKQLLAYARQGHLRAKRI
jgi:PIN domain nuclease of toxin-antitoxin system